MSFRNMAVFSVLMAGGVLSGEAQEIVTYTVGKYEVSMLMERLGDGNTGIIVGADEALLKKHIPTGSFKHQTNTFLIKSADRTVIVDTGFGTKIFDHLKTLRVDPAKVDAVLITHMHGDHISGLQKDGKPSFPNATVYLAEQEKAYWVPAGGTAGIPADQRQRYELAAQSLAPYGNKVKTFRPGELGGKLQEILPGIAPIAAFGHTPGHFVVQVQSEGKNLLILGDLMHVRYIQFARPDINMTYDMDAAASREMRKRIFDYAAKNKIPITGMHIVSPAFGLLEPLGDGGYNFKEIK